MCLFMSISGLNTATVILVFVIFALILAWHINHLYFGEPLRPDSLALLVKPDHFRDVVSVGLKEVPGLLRPLAVVAVGLALALYVKSWSPEHDWQGWSAALAWGTLGLACLRISAVVREKRLREWPEMQMTGLFGGLHALVVAIKWGITGVKPLPGAVTYSLNPVSDALVVVLMGESINPARMGLFSGLDTTARMDELVAGDQRFAGCAKVGFSAAVASNASVAGFLSGSPFSWRTARSRSLFDLARAQNFSTRYWSAQTRSPIEVLGDSRSVDDVYSLESAKDLFRVRKDWHLLDKLELKPFGGREFAFLYPRCNHAPYTGHAPCPSDDRDSKDDGLVERYDSGLRTFDAFVSDLLARIPTAGRRVFVFVTSDHNELLGDRGGLKGHNLSGQAACALVPYLLFTNDPASEVFKEFCSEDNPDAWSVAQLVLKVMGVDVAVEPTSDGSYICNSLPFGSAGYMKVSGVADPFMVDTYDRTGQLQSTTGFRKGDWLNRHKTSGEPVTDDRHARVRVPLS
jgi:hypothetical protein